MAIAFVNAGTWAAGTTSIAPGIPAGMAAGGFMLLAVHTPNQAVTTPTGWTQVTSSPVSTGTANTAGGTRLSLYYRFWQSGDAAPTVSVSGGTVTNGRIFGYSGVDPTTPFDATPVATTLATASTTLTWNGITTVTANCLIFMASARDQDLNNTAAVSGYTNANLTSLTERNDQVVNTGVGGGVAVVDGFKSTAGATGNTTATQTSSIAVSLTVALRPAPNAYTLTAQAGSYTLTGQSATLSRNRTLTASAGSYSLTGQSAVITHALAVTGYTLTAQAGSYAVTGQSATLTKGRVLTAQAGSYAQTGQSAILKRGRLIAAQAGAYTVNGSSATLSNSGEAATTQEAPRRHAGGRKGYIVQGQKYFLTEQELRALVAQLSQQVKRRDIQEVEAGKPKTMSRRTWLRLKQSLAALEALSEPEAPIRVVEQPYDEDDDEEAILMLL